jgi:HAMP domain-containing protein
VVVLLACVLLGFYLIRRHVLQPLAVLGNAARVIAASARLHPPQGAGQADPKEKRSLVELDLKTIQGIRTGDEVEALAADLATMASRVLRYQRELESEVEEKTAVIREDLDMAREFQHALLPSVYPDVPAPSIQNPLRLQFSHFYQPAATVGGDFFDLIELDENRAGILIADVMGHGARSALVTAILHTLVRKNPAAVTDPAWRLAAICQASLSVVSSVPLGGVVLANVVAARSTPTA